MHINDFNIAHTSEDAIYYSILCPNVKKKNCMPYLVAINDYPDKPNVLIDTRKTV